MTRMPGCIVLPSATPVKPPELLKLILLSGRLGDSAGLAATARGEYTRIGVGRIIGCDGCVGSTG